jgi:hypothetical protein
MHTLTFELFSFPVQCGEVIDIPNLFEPLRGPVFLMKDTPRESVVPVDIHGLSIKDVFVLTLEVVLEA